jgi:hypothetical protein
VGELRMRLRRRSSTRAGAYSFGRVNMLGGGSPVISR